jgi:hypothetical protein
MFHFPAFPPHTLYIQVQVTGHDSSQVSPFGHPRITARLPTPQGLSQATTSFIGSRCQGIHHVPFIACQTPQTHPTTKNLRDTLTARTHTPTRPPQRKSATRDAAQSNCYKDARVHYEKTKHPAHPRPTPPPRAEPAHDRHQKPTPHPHHTPDHQPVTATMTRARACEASEPQQCAPHPPAPHKAPTDKD